MFVAISAAHLRHTITKAWAEHTASLGFDAVYVSVTTDDTINAEICSHFGLQWSYMPNSPLAGKFNAALQQAMNDGASRFMILPSDDFISSAWFLSALTSTADYIIPHECAVVDSITQHAYRIDRNTGGAMLFGAGRVISRKVADRLDAHLWADHLERGLDSASHAAIIQAGFALQPVKSEGIPITDVKSEGNLWPFSTWRPGSRPCSVDEALHMLKPSIRKQLDALKIV